MQVTNNVLNSSEHDAVIDLQHEDRGRQRQQIDEQRIFNQRPVLRP